MNLLDPVSIGIAMALYVLAQIALGLYFARNVRTGTDFFVANRQVSFWPIALSLFATWFGAETIMGSSASIAAEGLSGARAEPFGYAITLAAMGFLIAAQFRARAYLTLADFMRQRFSRASEVWTAALMIIVSVIWAAAQLLALAKILEATLGIDAQVTLLVATVTVVFYTAFAGMIGDIVTDVVQSVVLVMGLVILFGAVAAKFGGVGEMLAAIKPEQLQILGSGESWLGQIDAWAIPILGSLITQEAISRFLASKDPATARRASFAAAAMYLGLGMIPLLIGLAGAHLVEVGGDADTFLPTLAQSVLPPALFLLFIGALFSAILSTIDSNLLSVSSFVSVNILAKTHAKATERGRANIARATTVLSGVAAYLIAMSGQTIYELIALTSVWGQAGILVAVLVGLWSPYGGKRAALWAILACVIVNLWTLAIAPVLAELSGGASLPHALAQLVAGEAPTMEGYFLVSIAASIVAYVIGAEVDKRSAAATFI